MSRRLVAAMPCRSTGSRLYGKPLQNLDIEKGFTILDYMITYLKETSIIDDVVLGISEGIDNLGYINVAKRHNISYIIGDEMDVLHRLIQCGERGRATDVWRTTTESPFPYFEIAEQAWQNHVEGDYDFTHLDHVPDGSGIEIIKLDTLKCAHTDGEDRHRSEFCSLYIRENRDKFRIQSLEAPKHIKRTDIRLTVDYPEDLVLCRAVYKHFRDKVPFIPLGEIIEYLDANPELKALVDPFIEEGMKTMYL